MDLALHYLWLYAAFWRLKGTPPSPVLVEIRGVNLKRTFPPHFLRPDGGVLEAKGTSPPYYLSLKKSFYG